MPIRLSRLFRWLLPIVALVLSLLAILSTTARWLVYDVEQYRDTVSSYFSEQFNLQSTMGTLRGRTDLFDAVIVVEDIRLSSEAFTQPFIVEQAEIILDLFGSIRTLQPRIKSIRMAGMELVLTVDHSSNLLSIPQLNYHRPLFDNTLDFTDLLQTMLIDSPTDISFYDTKIYLQDRLSGGSQHLLELRHFVVEPSYFGTKVGLDIDLPEYFGKHLVLIAQVDGSLQTITSDFYLNLETIDLAHASQWLGVDTQRSGHLQSELWGQWSSDEGLHSLSGTLALTDYRDSQLRLGDVALHLKTTLDWQIDTQHRQFALTDFSLRSSAFSLTNANLAIFQTPQNDSYQTRLRIAAEQISASLLNRVIVAAKPYLGADTIKISATGDNHRFDLALHFEHGQAWLASLHRWPPIVALGDTKQRARLQWQGLQANLALNQIEIEWDRWERQRRTIEQIEIAGTYIHSATHPTWQIDQILIRHNETELSGKIGYRQTVESRDLSLAIQLERLPAEQISQWLPQGYLYPALQRWLLSAFHHGQITQLTAELNGDPYQFPFKDGGGQWHLAATVEDLNMTYRNNDPQLSEVSAKLLIENQALSLHSDHLRMNNFYAKQTTIQIEDISKPYIEINSDGRGPLIDVLSYLKTRGLVDSQNVLITQLLPKGEVRLNIDVNTRLSSFVERATYVGGFLDFEGASLSLNTLQWNFDDLQGRLYFDSNGGKADQIRAKLNGSYPLTATADSKKGTTLLKMAVAMPFYQVYPPIMPLLKDFVSDGNNDWHAELLIPPLKVGHQQTLKLKLQSDLKTVEVRMPTPLHKDSETALPSTLEMEIEPFGTHYRLDYGKRLHLHLQVPKRGKPTGNLRFSPQVAYPDRPISHPDFFVRGVIEHLSIDEWLDWRKQHQTADQIGHTYLKDIDLLVREATWNASTLSNVVLVAKQKEQNTVVEFDSNQLSGKLSVPFNQDQRIHLHLDRLILSPEGFVATHKRLITPTAIPPMLIKIGYFDNGHFNINQLHLLLNPTEQGVDITEMTFAKVVADKTLMETKLRGRWTKKGDGYHSDFQFKLISNDYGSLLKAWDLYNGLKGAKGLVSGSVSWDGSPLDVQLEKLYGSVRLQVDDGVIETIEPGVGRLFGLLNVGALARRFTLDFKDVLDKGLEFDKVRGSLKFEDANMWTSDFKLDSNALEMVISGRTGIAARDYDQKIKVIPHLSSNIPWATAFIGGPLAGVAAFLFSKVSDIDSVVDKALTLDYTLTGSWDNPKVEFVGTPSMDKIKQPAGKIKQIMDKILPQKKSKPEPESSQSGE